TNKVSGVVLKNVIKRYGDMQVHPRRGPGDRGWGALRIRRSFGMRKTDAPGMLAGLEEMTGAQSASEHAT
ncbi:MAG: hypothetical protein NXI02_29940, partial [Rhodobacteraceae bacterium]|nr:hypothetical protein [Paracoccaceae bacterium]